jgi:hypothetical protein
MLVNLTPRPLYLFLAMVLLLLLQTMEACEEGNGKDECVQRRLLLDAHLDYIYTQHKGKP